MLGGPERAGRVRLQVGRVVALDQAVVVAGPPLPPVLSIRDRAQPRHRGLAHAYPTSRCGRPLTGTNVAGGTDLFDAAAIHDQDYLYLVAAPPDHGERAAHGPALPDVDAAVDAIANLSGGCSTYDRNTPSRVTVVRGHPDLDVGDPDGRIVVGSAESMMTSADIPGAKLPASSARNRAYAGTVVINASVNSTVMAPAAISAAR